FDFVWSDLACYSVVAGLGILIERVALRGAIHSEHVTPDWIRPMGLIDHPQGDYRFLPGLAPYSGGVVSAAGWEIVHVTLHRPVSYRLGFERIERHLATERRPRGALCAIELRSPKPYTFEGFAEFNAGYAHVLEGWGLFVGGINPVARTNVSPEVD